MKAGSTEFVLIYIAVAAVVGSLVGYAIGRAKGRPGLGLVLGLLFGLLGWIITAVLPRPQQTTRAQKPSRGWYPDPTGAHEVRYFDGNNWMADVADRGEMSEDPIENVPVG